MGCLIKMVKHKGQMRNLSFIEAEKKEKNKKSFRDSKRKSSPKK